MHMHTHLHTDTFFAHIYLTHSSQVFHQTKLHFFPTTTADSNQPSFPSHPIHTIYSLSLTLYTHSHTLYTHSLYNILLTHTFGRSNTSLVAGSNFNPIAAAGAYVSVQVD